MHTLRIFLASLLLIAVNLANAAIINEWDVAVGDTGDTPSSASILYGDTVLNQINGKITGDSRRVDMYGIFLSTNDLFGLSTEITSGNPGVLSVFLFDQRGVGLLASIQQSGSLSNYVPSYSG